MAGKSEKYVPEKFTALHCRKESLSELFLEEINFSVVGLLGVTEMISVDIYRKIFHTVL